VNRFFLKSNRSEEVMRMDIQTSSQLLQTLVSPGGILNETEKEDVATIAQYLNGLPLALDQLAAYICKKKLTFRQFKELWDSTARKFNENSIRRTTYSQTIEMTFEQSFRSLHTGRSLLEVLSFFDPDEIQVYIFQDWDNTKPNEPFCQSKSASISSLKELLAASLVRQSSDAKTISVHRLIQEIVQSKLSPGRFNSTFESAVSLLFSAWPLNKHGTVPNHIANIEKLLPHLLKVYGFSSKYTLKVPYGVSEATKYKLIKLFDDTAL
jgi:hypothetical protein